MLSLTVCFFVTVTVVIFSNFVEGDDLASGTPDRLKSNSEKMYFPTDLPQNQQHHGQPCLSCNYHNHEGYPPANPHKDDEPPLNDFPPPNRNKQDEPPFNDLPPPNRNKQHGPPPNHLPPPPNLYRSNGTYKQHGPPPNHLPPPNLYRSNENYPQTNFQHTYEFHHNHDFPPEFKHNPEFHERHFGGRDAKDFEDRNGGSNTVEYKNVSMNEIPFEFFEKLDNTDVDDLLANYVEGFEQAQANPVFGNRFGDDGQERNAGMIPAKATCSPESVSVSLATSDDPSVVYIPKCTRIERCGGCCSHKLLACQPTETATISVQVIKTQYTGAKKLKYVGKEIIPLEKHLKCKCSCKIKAEHCLPNQTYRSNVCGCICSNKDEEEKCNRDPDRKYWDYQTCTCKCRNVIQCSTGSFYDNNECRCKTTPKRRYAKYDRRIIIVKEDAYMTPVTLYDLK